MSIDWASLGIVAAISVVAAIAVIGVFSLGVLALTTGSHDQGRSAGRPMKLAGYACLGVSALFVLYGLYLIIPGLH